MVKQSLKKKIKLQGYFPSSTVSFLYPAIQYFDDSLIYPPNFIFRNHTGKG